jgi:hypothetical protein
MVMDGLVGELKKLLKEAENLADHAANIHINNNKQTINWIANHSARSAPNMIRENIGGLTLTAKRVEYIDEVGPDLCYIPSINRFAVRFAGIVLAGNIGNMYAICSAPERVKECHFANVDHLPAVSDKKYRMPKCSKTDGECLFYHDPQIFPSSKEPRNFFATCGHYVSADDPNTKNSNYLRYGNRATLKEDLMRLSAEEMRRFEDYVAHLVLCLIIMRRF